MNRWIVRHILYPLHERLRGRSTARYLAEFRANDRLPFPEAGVKHDTALAALLRHAVREVPYFRDIARARGLDPAKVGAADLTALPPMTKDLIRKEKRRLIADSHADRVFSLATGGSSGEPLIFWTDKDRESSQLAAKLRARAWWGIEWGDRQTDLWGSPIEIGAQDRFRVWKDRLLNFSLLSAFALSDEKMAAFKDALRAHRTEFLYGYASVLDRYAAFLERRGDSLADLRLKGAISTAELLFPEARARIARVFGCPVINEYGCRDGGFIAQECPKGRMHIAYDAMHVEILDGDRVSGPGEVGDIHVTNLFSYGMPIVRYKLGDRAALDSERCTCGLPYPLLRDLSGRITDTLLTPEGNRVHGLGVMYVIRVLDGVLKYRVVQNRPEAVEVEIIAADGADRPKIEAAIKEGLAKVLGRTMRISVAFVQSIPDAASGKMRAIVCNV